MSVDIRTCEVVDIVDETKEAKSFHLALGDGCTYQPGQFITLVLNIEGQEVSRSYSLSSIPTDGHGRITVKKIHGGKASNYLCQSIKVGDKVQYKGPDGIFCLPELNSNITRVFVGAGSGITPLMGMLRQSLQQSQAPHLLFYGNKREEDVIFKNDIDQLSEANSNLKVRHFYSEKKWIHTLFQKKKSFSAGRIEPEDIWYDIIDLGDQGENAVYFICGPSGMNEKLKEALLGYGIDEENIKVEFYSSGINPISDSNASPSQALVLLDNKEINIEVLPGHSILDSLISSGHNPPHSCTSGACCTCMAIIKEGEVKMNRSDALSKSEIKDGFILTCQAIPTTEKVVVDYDVY